MSRSRKKNWFIKTFWQPTPWKSITIPAMLIVLSTLIFFYTLLYWNQVGQRNIMDEFVLAARTGNMHAINQRTDWVSIRASMKKDLQQRAKSTLGKTTGMNMSDASLNALVDYYVKPANIPTLFYYRSQYARDIHPREFIRRSYFTALDEFVVEVGYPPQNDKPWTAYIEPVKILFKLDGFQWRLKQIIPPLYVVPQKVPVQIVHAQEETNTTEILDQSSSP